MTRDYSFWITYMKISDQFLHRLSFFQSSYQFVAFFFLQSFRQFTLYCTLGNLFTSHNQPTSAHESREYCVPILFTTETATRRRRRGRRRRWNWRKSNRIETFRVPPSLRVQVKLSFQFRHVSSFVLSRFCVIPPLGIFLTNVLSLFFCSLHLLDL